MTAHRMTRSEFVRRAETIGESPTCNRPAIYRTIADLAEVAGVEWLPEKRRLKVGDVIDRDTDLDAIEWANYTAVAVNPARTSGLAQFFDWLGGRWHFTGSRDSHTTREMVSTFGPLTVVWVPGGDSDA